MEKEKKALIYIIRYKGDLDLFYIGKTEQEFEERIKQHKQSARSGSSTPFHRALIDHGLLNWDWEILEYCSCDEVFEKEKEFIRTFHATSVDLLNDTHNKSKELKKSFVKKDIEAKLKGNKFVQKGKSEFGKLFLRQAGKIKPVKNLKTGTVHETVTKAEDVDGFGRARISESAKTGKIFEDNTRYAFLDIEDNLVLTKGHDIDIYFNKKNADRKIKNLVTGKVFDKLSEAALQYDLSGSYLAEAAKGKYKVVNGKWVFCYLDLDGNEVLEKNHKEGLILVEKSKNINYIAWHIGDIEMLKPFYFKNINELCEGLGIKGKSHVPNVCSGERAHVEKWRIALYDYKLEKPILHEKHKQKPRKVLRGIICLNDGRKFESGTAAGKHYQLSSQAISKCAHGNAKSVYKGKDRLRFAFLNDNGEPIMTEKHKESLSAKGKVRMYVVKTFWTISCLI